MTVEVVLWMCFCALTVILSGFLYKPAYEKPVLSPEWAEYVANMHVSDLKWLEKQLDLGLKQQSGHGGHAEQMEFFDLVREEINKRKRIHDRAWCDLIEKTERKITLIDQIQPKNEHPPGWYGPFWTLPDAEWEYVAASTLVGPTVYYRTGKRAS